MSEPIWNLEQDLVFRRTWNDLMGFLWSTENPEHKAELYAANLMRKLVVSELFREQFAADPKKVLAELGIHAPADLKINVVENTATTMHLVLPALMSPPDYAEGHAAIDLEDSDLTSFVTGEVAFTLFNDNFDRLSASDGADHDADVLPFFANNTGDKFKTVPKDPKNDLFGI